MQQIDSIVLSSESKTPEDLLLLFVFLISFMPNLKFPIREDYFFDF